MSVLGRPPYSFPPERVEELISLFDKYIQDTEIPIVAEFATMNNIYKQRLYDIEDFADCLKRCTTKKEAALERQGLSNKCNTTMAIFSLKQLGWKDKSDEVVEQKDPLNITINMNGVTDPAKQDNLEIHEG